MKERPVSKFTELHEFTCQTQEVIEAYIHVLVKTLEEAGVIKAEHYVGNLRLYAEMFKKHGEDYKAFNLNHFAKEIEAKK